MCVSNGEAYEKLKCYHKATRADDERGSKERGKRGERTLSE